jgi:hypothetical protein
VPKGNKNADRKHIFPPQVPDFFAHLRLFTLFTTSRLVERPSGCRIGYDNAGQKQGDKVRESYIAVTNEGKNQEQQREMEGANS